MGALILTEAELRRCAEFDADALAATEHAFVALDEGAVAMPPIMHVELADRGGDVDVKSAYVPGVDRLAVKIASGFFGNPRRGLPSSSAMMVVLSAETGLCEAVLLDNGYLTDLRTGLAGAVAARWLAPEKVSTVGIVGTGAQARYQVRGLALVREFDAVLVAGRSPDLVAAYVEEMGAELGVEVRAADSIEALVRASDVVVTTTPSREPVVRGEWLRPGVHVTAMGSDLAGKRELDGAALVRADRLVCDRLSQCTAMGELQRAVAAGVDLGSVVELGAIAGGRAAGRSGADQITVCDLTGTGVQDTAIADLAVRRAAELGLGTRIGA